MTSLHEPGHRPATRASTDADAAVDERGPATVSDPWAVDVEDRSAQARGSGALLVGVGAAIAASFGPVARFIDDRDTAAVLTVVALAGAAVAVLGAARTRRPALAAVAGIAATLAVVRALTLDAVGTPTIAAVVLGSFVAHQSFHLPWPWATDRRSARTAPLALPFLVLAGVSQIDRPAPVGCWIALASAALVVEATRRLPAPFRRIETAVRTGVSAVATAIGLVVLGAVAAVLLYLPGAFAAMSERNTRRRPAASFWRTRPPSADLDRRDADRPFSSAQRGPVPAGRVVGAIAVVAVGVLVAVTVDPDTDTTASTPPPTTEAPPGSSAPTTTEPPPNAGQLEQMQLARDTKMSDLPAFADVAFADEMQEEQQRLRDENLTTSDVGGLEVTDFESRSINVRDGERASLKPPACRCEQRTVWFIGGSAAFGFGQRDDHTIASQLVRLASADRIALTIHNFAVPGLTLFQEIEKVEDRLRNGAEPPDAVVFFDGFNDTAGTMVSSTVRGMQPDEPSRLDFNEWFAMEEQGLDPNAVAPTVTMAKLAADRYQRERSAVVTELDRRGIASLFVFQPDALASAEQYEAASVVWNLDEPLLSYLDDTLAQTARRLAPDVVDLREMFDGVPQPVFFDLMHTNEAGAASIASKIYPHLGERLGLTPARAPGG